MKTRQHDPTPQPALPSISRPATAPNRPITPPASSPLAGRLQFSLQDISLTRKEAETKARQRNEAAPPPDQAQTRRQRRNDQAYIHTPPIQPPIQQPRSRLQLARRGGQPLPSGTQKLLEERMGANLEAVRIHADPEADSLARLFNARAFTTGPDIFFSRGEYHPSSMQGMRVLTEEIEHTIQQSVGPVSSRLRIGGIPVSDPSDRFERQATSVAARVAGRQSVGTRAGGERPCVRQIPSAPLVLQRAIGKNGATNQKVRDKRGTIFIIRDKKEESDGTSYTLQREDGSATAFTVESENDAYELAAEPTDTTMGDTVESENDNDQLMTESTDTTMGDTATSSTKKRKREPEESSEDAKTRIRQLLNSKRFHHVVGTIKRILEEDQPEFDEDLAEAIREKSKDLAHGSQIAIERALKRWKTPETESEGKRPAKKRRVSRKKADTERKPVLAYEESGDESSLSEEEMDIDTLPHRHQLTAVGLVNPSHIPTQEDLQKSNLPPKDFLTSLHHSNTYLGVWYGGQFVPRTIKGKPNSQAHRKKLPEVSGTGIEAGKRTRQINNYIRQRDDVSADEEKRSQASITARRLFEQTFFGSTIPFEEGEEKPDLTEQRQNLQKDLLKEESDTSVSTLLERKGMPGMRGGTVGKTHGDAEQKLLSSVVWHGLLARLQKAIAASRDQKEGKAVLNLKGHRIVLLLNRSSCLGCGKALTLALIQFWKDLAPEIGVKTWQEARDAYKDQQLFTIAFPVIYEYSGEKKGKFANFKAILHGLQEAGWNIRIPQANLELNAHAQENQNQLEELLTETGSTKQDMSSTDETKST